VHVIPINVKVDRLVKGGKDIFINVGHPVFFGCPKEEFNERLGAILRLLHTITFSQIATCYCGAWRKRTGNARDGLELARERFVSAMERIT
jgi:hypothetical protein